MLATPVRPLAGIPSVESPAFDEVFEAPGMDAETRRVATSLRRDGYAVIEFPDADFARRAEAIRTALRDRYDWEGWRAEGFAAGRGLRVQDAWSFDENVRSLATNAALLDLLGRLYGRAAKPFQTLNFPVGTQQEFHFDSIHFSSMPQRFMCGVWVALEDIAAGAGPLVYYPGSHAWPICTNDVVDARAGEASLAAVPASWQALVRLHRAEPRRFLARKGQALIWAANLLHGGDRQSDPALTRWSQVTHYYFEGCAYYTPLFSDPFAGRIAFRHPVDIVTGAAMPNMLGGAAISADFVAQASAGAARAPATPTAPPATPLEAALAEARDEVRQLRAQVDAMHRSRSWRLTAPLRRLVAGRAG